MKILSVLISASLCLCALFVFASPLPQAPDCQIFPPTNVWNKDIGNLPVHPSSRVWINAIGANATLHPDFGKPAAYGIPINVVTSSTARHNVQFDYSDESDHLPYPIPLKPKIEGGGDRHILMVDKNSCRLYELYDVRKVGSQWYAGSGATWNLNSNALRHNGWTSADAAGLPIVPGLVRYDEVAKGLIDHALRFTAPRTRSMHIYPARHDAGESSSASLPPMGLRLRLKKSVNLNGFSPRNRVILTALKRYGMILADNGSAIYITGVSNANWNDSDLHLLGRITGKDFEVVDTRNLRNGN